MAPVNVLALEIADFKSGTRTVELVPTPEDLDLDPVDFRDIRVTAHLDRTGDRVFVQFDVTGTARLQCDRTLVDFDQALEGRYGVLFASAEALEDLGDDLEDIREFDPTTHEIDVTEAVRHTMLLSIPLRRIAPGAEDVPIQTSYGDPDDDDIADPRWEALRKLKENPHQER